MYGYVNIKGDYQILPNLFYKHTYSFFDSTSALDFMTGYYFSEGLAVFQDSVTNKFGNIDKYG